MKNKGIFASLKKLFGGADQIPGLKFDLRKSGTYGVSGVEETAPSELVIPETYQDLPVAYINRQAFHSFKNITSVTIPNSILRISAEAFANCTGLTSIEIPARVKSIEGNIVPDCTNLTSITVSPENQHYYAEGNCLINKRTGELQSGCSTSVIPNDGSIKSIGRNAFRTITGLKNVTIPDSVTNVGFGAFSDCTSLEFTIYENAKYLGNPQNPHFVLISAVDETVTTCTVHPNTKLIAEFAFSHHKALTSITIPDSVTTIGCYAFVSCKCLKSVTLGNGVTSIAPYAFDECTSLAFEEYENARYLGNPKNPHHALISLVDRNVPTFTLHPSTTVIADGAFRDCRNLAFVTIPAGVTSIGESAFEGCTSLMGVGLPESITSIGNFAFHGCTSLTGVSLPEGVVTIGSCAFYECSALTEMTIPDSVTYIGSSAFYNCEGITNMTVGNGVTRIEDSVFAGCRSLTHLSFSNSVTHIEGYSFMCCSNLRDVYYRGTSTEWEAVNRDIHWKGDSSPFTLIHCTDGDVNIQVT